MIRWDLAPEVLTLLGGACLTIPAVRAGNALMDAMHASQRAAKAVDSDSAEVFEAIKEFSKNDSWKPIDQHVLWVAWR